jgi:hypothetical protein
VARGSSQRPISNRNDEPKNGSVSIHRQSRWLYGCWPLKGAFSQPSEAKARTKAKARSSCYLQDHRQEPTPVNVKRLLPPRQRRGISSRFSQRQLPTDQDYAVLTREYQTDQSSLIPATVAAGPVLEKRQKQRQKRPHRCAGVDRVTLYQSYQNTKNVCLSPRLDCRCLREVMYAPSTTQCTN